MTRRFLLPGIAAIAVVVAIGILLLLPPRRVASTPPEFALTWPVMRGAYHVHSQRSDGTGTIEEIAAAAARAGLHFVILTDHGDATRPPEPPAYRSGVLCIDAVEISTDDGHYVALGIPRAPYPLRGHARDVIEDVHRLGGFGMVAHPDSAKAELQWRDWSAPFDGMEWLNADSEWRNQFWASLTGMLLTYPFRPVETLGALLDRPQAVLHRWQALLQERRVITLAAADAHARLGYRQSTDPYEDRVLARVPGYDVSFRAFTNHVVLPHAPTGDAAHDADLLLEAVREGHAFTSLDSLAGLSALELRATSGNAAAVPGAYLDVSGPVAIEADIAAPAGTTMVILRNGALIYETRESALRIDVGLEPGAYHMEARLPWQDAADVPWILTNPIYVGLKPVHARAIAARAVLPPVTTREGVATESWTAEASPGSESVLQQITLDNGTPAQEWRFEIAGGARASQYAAIRFPVREGFAAQDRLQLRARSDLPRRVWVQLRTSDAAGAERWGKSFHVGTDTRQIDLRFEEFRPLGVTSAATPPLARVDSLLLVIDTTHNEPGSAGAVAITDLWLAR